MTKAEQRILIAKDVIAQLMVGRFVARCGEYLRTPMSDMSAEEAARTQTCKVCARGAAVVAAVARFDALEGDVSELYWQAELGAQGGDRAYINRFFPARMLRDMENAFEGWDRSRSTELPSGDGRAWVNAYPDATYRLDAIMRNIVNNGGKFIITDIPRPRLKPIGGMKR